jgi:hypothetical protein
MTEEHSAVLDIEDGAFRELERALSRGGNGGRRGDGGNGGGKGPGGGGDDDGGGEDIGPLGRAMIEGLRRLGERQMKMTLEALELVLNQVVETATVAIQGDGAFAKQLADGLATSLRANANLSERVASLERQIAALERAAGSNER